MTFHEIELLSTTTNDRRVQLVHPSEITIVEAYHDGDPWASITFGGKMPPTTMHYAFFCRRLEYCKAGYEAVDDPVARPLLALANAMQGAHSQSMTRAQVQERFGAYMTPTDFEVAMAFAAGLTRAWTAAPAPTGPKLRRLGLNEPSTP